MSKEKSAFIQWLNQELTRRGWSDNQLARQAGLSHSVISRARAGLLPKWEACVALANALQTPPELVFRKAGLLPSENSEDVGMEEWKDVLARLTEKDRHELLRIARLKLELGEEDRR